MHKGHKSANRSSAFVLAAILAGGFGWSAPVAAQDEAASETDDAGAIVVTARRREERLIDVPIAVTAISGEALDRSGALDITDVANMTPNTTLENSRGTNSTLTAFIRGVGQQDPVPGFEAGIGIYLDDVYLNRPQAAVLDIYDVERIEVLRGPQGTLYGRNTIGGAVKYVTRNLNPDKAELRIRGTYGTYDQADLVVTGSAPLGDMFRVGGSVARLSRGGFGDNLNIPGLENYNKDVWAGRGTIEFGGNGEPVMIRISGDYTRDKSDPRNGHRLIPGLKSGAPVLDDVYDTRAGLNQPKQDVKAYGLAMNATAELTDSLTFRSISAWRKDRSFTPIDFDALPSVDVDVPAVYRNEQVSQEFQLLYESERLHGLVGFYYLDAQAATSFDVLLGLTGAALGLPGLNGYTAGDVRTKTWSVFGDFTYDFTSQISLSVGGRYTNDRRRAFVYKANRITGLSPEFGGTLTPVAIAVATDFRGERTFKEFTPRASLSYKPDEDNLVYASYSKGFKGGGFDPRGSGTSAPISNPAVGRTYDDIYDFLAFDPEKVASYELGYKGSLLDRRLTLSLAGFYMDYKDVQIPGSVGCLVGGVQSFCGITTNAAKARLQGVEAEVNAVLARDFVGAGSTFRFNGALGYIDAKYKRFIGPAGTDVSDQRVFQNTPKWTLAGTLAAGVPAMGGTIDLSTTVSYRSLTHQFETPIPALDQPGYVLWDASLVWTADSGAYSIGVHGKNLTDKQYITSGYNYQNAAGASTLGQEGVLTAFYGNPRQVFVTGTVQF
ncbi:TonB-dependent receptor [Novosphingobium album (ex Liu et al. 2023)]|uniref:TonB-dependent receptor n=1 Tax=Novosphingobium album (ex Liu et al. 2023) TaxID=3031130 RepID=A0ABT5WML7_9SPHN|nr:TonB-dependent receptor [Novosphingobium album (ex Liu et al. 2023)]MDE8651291.1 TonB-dependent receptor [Novosphingobium album (ex Liu et al. 2023)]